MKIEELKVANLNDCWVKMYVHVARSITSGFGYDGEYAVRKALRNFGHDRGSTLRDEQLELGMKINMYNLWTYYDLPGDARFKRNKIRLTETQRISQTLVCPMATLWNEMDANDLGVLYCDEFHPAMFSGYHNKIITNLGETLTHDTDDHCHFALYLDPGNMNAEERKYSFAEFDENFSEVNVGDYVLRSARDGYNILTIKLFYHLAKEAIDAFADDARVHISKAVEILAQDIKSFLTVKANALGVEFDSTFLKENCPISMDINDDKLWNDYASDGIKELFANNFYSTFVNL